jgi:hypothetical protein
VFVFLEPSKLPLLRSLLEPSGWPFLPAFQFAPPSSLSLASMPKLCHALGMNAMIRLDVSNRIVLTRDLRKVAGIAPGQKLRVSATPGRIVLEVEPNPGQIVMRGKLKVWTGEVPATPLEEAVEQIRGVAGHARD